jgi:hypothetical protein
MPDFETLPIGTKDRMAALERVAQQALEALTTPMHEQRFGLKQDVIVALRAALAQQETVPRRHQDGGGDAAWHRLTLT